MSTIMHAADYVDAASSPRRGGLHVSASPAPMRRARVTVPSVSARISPTAVASVLARLIASGEATTRADLVKTTGLARSTVGNGLDLLGRGGVITNLGARPMIGRGRPAEELGLSSRYGIALVADLGATPARLAAYDLRQNLLSRTEILLAPGEGAESVMTSVASAFQAMLDERGTSCPPPLVAVIALPQGGDRRSPLSFSGSGSLRPDAYPASMSLADGLRFPVLYDSDVNLRALGEARTAGADGESLLYVKVDREIRSAFVSDAGTVLGGADGAAGDIGHIPTVDHLAACSCGRTGCLNAVASLSAIARRIGSAKAGEDGAGGDAGALEAIRSGDPLALEAVRSAASQIGQIAATLVGILNPARIVVGGAPAEASGEMLAGIRTSVYERALPSATKNLIITSPVLGEMSAVSGALVLGIEHVLTEESLHAGILRRLRAQEGQVSRL